MIRFHGLEEGSGKGRGMGMVYVWWIVDIKLPEFVTALKFSFFFFVQFSGVSGLGKFFFQAWLFPFGFHLKKKEEKSLTKPISYQKRRIL